MIDPILQTHNLCKSFGALKATNDVSIDLLKGEIHALIGPNGAGKSTLLMQIAGEMPPDSGSIEFEGVPINQLSQAERVRKGLARSYQQTSVIASFSVWQNVILATQGSTHQTYRFFNQSTKDPNLIDRATQSLQRTGLAAQRNVKAATLSHGERRRLEVAMALAIKPKAFLLDEPMAGIGLEGTKQIISLLEELRKEAPILLIEHDMDAVFSLADRISVLVRGRIIATDTPAKIRNNESARNSYLGYDDS